VPNTSISIFAGSWLISPLVPLAVAAPATAAGLLYLNAKWSISYDYRLLVSLLTSIMATNLRESRGRLNPFYVLEDRTKDKKLTNRAFLIFEGRRWTFKQVYETVLKYGTWLKTTFGIKHQEIVAMDFMNSEKFIFMQLGLWSIGARPAFINYNLTGKPLAHCIRVSSARLVLVDPDVASNVADEVRAELPGVEFVIFTPQLEVEVMHTTAVREPDTERLAGKMQDMANLIYTSGTTGLPKPAVVSWHKNIAGPLAVAKWMGIRKTDIFYTVSAALFLKDKSNVTSACLSTTLQLPFLDS
jgi:acyl-coenzyme A synthetase/AMP-(fatty) acid ligase